MQMKTREILRLSFEVKYAYFVLWFLLLLGLTAFGTDIYLEVISMLGVMGMVSAYAIDMNRARLYGLSRKRIRSLRLLIALFIAIMLVGVTVPGFMIVGSSTLYFALAGAVIGMMIQLGRHPEESFDPLFSLTKTGTKARSLAWDIVWKHALIWLALPPFFLALYLFLYRQAEGDFNAFSTLDGGMGGMFAVASMALKGQLKTWTIFGGSGKTFYRHSWLAYGLIGLSFGVHVVIIDVLANGRINYIIVVLAILQGMVLQVAIVGTAFRRTNRFGPVLAFAVVIGYLIFAEGVRSANSNQLLAISTAVISAIWLFLSTWYIPRRLATRRFGSTGIRQMLGADDKISL